VLRRAPAAARRPAVQAVAVPAAAPDHPERAPRRPSGVAARAGLVVVLVVPVGAPLPHVAVYVVKVEPVGVVRAHRAGTLQVQSFTGISVGIISVEARPTGGEGIAEVEDLVRS